MIRAYYDIMLAASIVFMITYVCMWHKHFDVHITLVFALVPIANLGYWLQNRAVTLEEALFSAKLTYIGGCYLLPIMMFSVFSLCDIRLHKALRAAILSVSSAVYLAVLTIGKTPLLYKSVSFERIGDAGVLVKEYGPMHNVFYAMIIVCFALSVGAMTYSYIRKKQVSRKLIYLLFLPMVLSLLGYVSGRWIRTVEPITAAFVISMATFLVIGHRICMYDITDTAIDSLVQTGDTGLISFDLHFNYLGSNQTAKNIFPELNNLVVDETLTRSVLMTQTALNWLEAFSRDETQNQIYYERWERVYLVRVGYLYDGSRKRGYQFFITDDTADRQYINLLNSFNTQLKEEVTEKTAHIVQMHDNLIMSMATMVESRDNSTGGHIRRTSEGVRLLTAEIRADGAFGLSDEFCSDLIKAAPMHDLGKIAVEDAILRKPGRFTPEEFEKMKTHTSEGARIVHEILAGSEDDAFRRIAENVAHYHHERWDGSGYPCGLKGEQIPLEARIMAVADVYDALVSKRVYKESMSFEQAHAIIMDGMGRHFDERLKPYYLRAKPALEAYYLSLGAENRSAG